MSNGPVRELKQVGSRGAKEVLIYWPVLPSADWLNRSSGTTVRTGPGDPGVDRDLLQLPLLLFDALRMMMMVPFWG